MNTLITANNRFQSAPINRKAIAPGAGGSEGSSPKPSGDIVDISTNTGVEAKAPSKGKGWVMAGTALALGVATLATAQPAAAHQVSCGITTQQGYNNWGQAVTQTTNTCNGQVNWTNHATGQWGSYYDGNMDYSQHHHGGHHSDYGHHHDHGRYDNGHHGHHRGHHNDDVEEFIGGVIIGTIIGGILSN